MSNELELLKEENELLRKELMRVVNEAVENEIKQEKLCGEWGD